MSMQLQATPRTVTGKQVNRYRKENKIPGILYGKSLEKSLPVFFDKNTFLKVYKETGKSLPVTIKGDGIDHLVLIHTIALNPVTTMLSHVDFLVVKKGEAVHAEVELRFISESPVEKAKTGRVNELLSTVQVYADPTKLPKYIDVDMSTLVHIHDVIFIKDLKLPDGVKVENDIDQAVITVVGLGDENEGAGDSENAAGAAAVTEETVA